MTDTSNSSSLVLVETLNPEDVFQKSGLEPLLKKVKEEVDAFIPDISTKKGRDEIKSFAHKIARSKTALDKLGADLVSEWKAQSKKVDADRRYAWDYLEKLQKQVRKPLDEFEEKEEQRIQSFEKKLTDIAAVKIDYNASTEAPSLELAIKALEELVVDGSWAEFEPRAYRYKQEALAYLKDLLAKRLQYDADQAELKRLREEQAAREQKEREEKIAKEVEEKAKREYEEAIRLEKERSDRIEQQMKDALEKEKRNKEKAERDAIEAAEKAKKDKEEAENRAREQERLRIQKEQEREEAEKKAREADLNNRKRVNNEILTALKAEVGISENESKQIIEAIARGKIPNVKITY